MDGNLVVSREMDDLDGLIGESTPALTTLSAPTCLDALVEGRLLIDDAVCSQ